MNDAEKLIDLLIKYYDVVSVSQLADKIDIGQPALSKWKKNNSVGAIKKKCRELGIYNEIFGDLQTNNFQNSNNVIGQDFSKKSKSSHTQNIGQITNIEPNILKLVDTLYSFAVSKGKIDELKNDLSMLLPKYM
ncbi:MAG: hypothetical protein PHX44_08200 [Sulfurimonas sp.]|uniref:hypothetical protein n=1 Tax=Sulfurimonas sp. TaxID=2022749 RepID=UPI002614FC8E|nr:hypothetical protein [Sulfurimonas sp.]MDD2653015.1 hypothetical protein [Sulfurimonas sp.]MDD3452461.1 hypothetical protein [Sulfurimonas sp.]